MICAIGSMIIAYRLMKKIVKGSNISETRKLSFKLLSSLADNCTSNAEAIADLLKDEHQFKNENEDDATTTESTAIVCGDQEVHILIVMTETVRKRLVVLLA